MSRLDRPRPVLGSLGVFWGILIYIYIYFFLNVFIWLHWVLVVACGI